MITEDRSLSFWRPVFEHPAVNPHVALGHDVDLDGILSSSLVTALRADHGGFLFVQLDGAARLFELHTMFTPEGWGREALFSAKEAFAEMFRRGAQIVTTFEVEGNQRSQPPRSFGFVQAGEFSEVAALGVRMRSWVLTCLAWNASMACKRMMSCH